MRNTPQHPGMDLDATTKHQDGLISRRQALGHGLSVVEIKRRLRRRDWVAVHPGVYVNHTGKLTWRQRAWAAVLAAGPGAALRLDSALRAHEGPGRKQFDDSVIHVAVPHGRRLLVAGGRATPPDRGPLIAGPVEQDTALHQVRRHRPRPRLPRDGADLGGRARRRVRQPADHRARLRDRLDGRKRIAQRDWLRSVLSDVADGTCSVLEHGYLDLVERPHGLPGGTRQAVRDLATAASTVTSTIRTSACGSSWTASCSTPPPRTVIVTSSAISMPWWPRTARRSGSASDRSTTDRARRPARFAAVLQRHGWTVKPTPVRACSELRRLLSRVELAIDADGRLEAVNLVCSEP